MNPITLAVLQGALANIVDEMDLRLIRAAISPIISESKDMASGIFDPDSGEMWAQGQFGLPVFLAQMQSTVELCIAEARNRGGFKPGDIWITNDVYRGGTHLNDIQLVSPVYYEEKLVALLANTGHWQDIGGSTPGGWNPHATDIHEEGIQVPPTLLHEGGRVNEALIDMIAANVRLKSDLIGDLAAMLSAIREGDRRLRALCAKHGVGELHQCVSELVRRAEAVMRGHLAEIPNGRYEFTDYIDNDGIVADPIRIAVALEIAGSDAHVDFTGSAPACLGPMNLSRNTTVAAAHIALRHVFTDVPANGGAFRPFRFTIRRGSCLWAEDPRPVSGYLEVLGRVIDAVTGALAQSVPEKVAAACFGTSSLLTISGLNSRTGEFYALTNPFPGGYGGSIKGDGLLHGPTPQSMARSFGLEMAERRYPIRFDYWEIRPDSGGAGRFRGGCGTQYRVTALDDECQVTVLGDRADHRPFGIFGGLESAANELSFTLSGKPWLSPFGTKARKLALHRGDSVHLASPGGGGYGRPEERELTAVEHDLNLGYVSPPAAERDYGVRVHTHTRGRITQYSVERDSHDRFSKGED